MSNIIDNPPLKTSPFEKIPDEVDTHELFDTISHSHVDYVDSPDGWVELLVVGCENGTSYIENGQKEKSFERFTEVCQPHILPFMKPSFFASEREAWDRAEEIMREVYPEYIKQGESK